MRKWILFSSLFLILLFLSACSSSLSLELVDTHVEVVEDKQLDEIIEDMEITEDGTTRVASEEKEGASIYYEFTIKNTGEETIDRHDVHLRIDPSDKLKSLSEDAEGVNIYNRDNNGLGFSLFKQDIEPDKSGTYILYYDLDGDEADVNELQGYALDAAFIVEINEREEIKFNLDK